MIKEVDRIFPHNKWNVVQNVVEDVKKEGPLGVVWFGLRAFSRFAGAQPIYDSWEYSTAKGKEGKALPIIGAFVTGALFPLATGIAQSTEGEGPRGMLKVFGASIMDVAFTVGGGGAGFFLPFLWIPTAVYRGIVTTATEALPRRSAVYEKADRRRKYL